MADNEKMEKYVKAKPITLKQYLRDQLFKDRTTETVEDIINQLEDKNLSVTEAIHDTQTANMKASSSATVGQK